MCYSYNSLWFDRELSLIMTGKEVDTFQKSITKISTSLRILQIKIQTLSIFQRINLDPDAALLKTLYFNCELLLFDLLLKAQICLNICGVHKS